MNAATLIFWLIIAVTVTIILRDKYKGERSRTTTAGSRLPDISIPKLNKNFGWGLLVVLLLGLGFWFREEFTGFTKVNSPDSGTIDLIVSFGVLIALAIAALWGKGGVAAKWALALVAAGILILGPTGFFGTYSNFQKGAKEVVLEGKPILSASAPVPSAAADVAAVENMVQLGQNQCTEPILLQNGWCIAAREEVVGKGAIRTEVLNASTQAWEMLPPGTFRKARYWRYCATEANAKVFYSVYKKPAEGCQSNTR